MPVEKTISFSRSMKIGRYLLDEKIGEGGMAEVFRARLTGNDGFEKVVCVKRILPHLASAPDFASMFRDEAAIAARLQHQNIVQVFDFGDEAGALYIAMEFVDGVSLARLLTTYSFRGERLPLAAVLKIGVEMCKGLHHAHTAKTPNGKPLGFVHRDVSPHNILLSRAGEVKVADFGVARAEGRRTHTQSGVVKGKTHYMAPEQALGLPFDHRLDQFATGIVLWESLTGRRLFKGKSDFLVLEAVTRVEIPNAGDMRDDVPPRLNAIVKRALDKDPEKRFPDMNALGAALDEVLFSTAKSAAALDLKPIVARALNKNAEGTPAPGTVMARAPELANIARQEEPFDEPTAAAMKAADAHGDEPRSDRRSGVWAPDGDDARRTIDDPTDNVDDLRTTSDPRGRIGAASSSARSSSSSSSSSSSGEVRGEPRTSAARNIPAPRSTEASGSWGGNGSRSTITAPTLAADERPHVTKGVVVAGGIALVAVAALGYVLVRGGDATPRVDATPTVAVGRGGIGSTCGTHDELRIAPSSALPWIGIVRPGENKPGDVRVVVTRKEAVGLVLAAESTVRWTIETGPGARVDRVILVSKWPQHVESVKSVTIDDMSGANAPSIDWGNASESVARAVDEKTGALAAAVVCPALAEVAIVEPSSSSTAGTQTSSSASSGKREAPAPITPELRVTDMSAVIATCDRKPLRYVAPQQKGTEVHVVAAGDSSSVRVTSSRTAPHAIVLASGAAKSWKIEREAGSGLSSVVVTGARGQRVSGAEGVLLVDLTRDGATSGWRWPETDASSQMGVTFAYAVKETDGHIASYVGCENMTSASIADGSLVPAGSGSGGEVASTRDMVAVRERIALITSPPERCARGCPDPLRLNGFRVFTSEELDPETPPDVTEVRRRLEDAVITADDARAFLAATERCRVCADE